MLLRNLKKVWISKYKEVNDHGEKEKIWEYKGKVLTIAEINKMKLCELQKVKLSKLNKENNKGIAWLNLQQDINELDRKSTGEIDYSVYKARTDKKYNIEKGDGISLHDISKKSEFKPDFTVKDIIQIGSSTMYRLVKMQ